jgi:phage-related minor tail protein
VREEAVVVLRLDTGNLPQATQQAAAAIGKIGQAGEISARQTAAAMRTLPAQFTDIATQLAGGQNPLLILLQQGGQIKDSFGGIGPAIRGIGAAISPVTLGIGALAAVVGTLGVAVFQGRSESEELRKTLLLSGNAAALTADRYQMLAEKVAAGSKQTVGGAKDIVIALASTGSVGAKAIDATAAAVARLADITGKDSADIARDFATMSNGVAKWAAEHNKAWNFITVEQFKYIKGLEEQGRVEEAMIATSEAFLAATKSQTRELGLLEGAWKGIREAASGAWDAMLNIGRQGSTRQQLDIAMSRLEALGGNLGPKAKDALEQRIQFLKEQLKLENQQADARGRNVSTNRSEIAKLQGGQGGARTSTGKPYIPDEFQVLDARDGMVAAAAYEKEQSRIDGFFNEALRAQEERDAKRLAAEQEFLDSLSEATRRASLELIEDEAARGEALVRLDLDIANRRLEAKGLTPGALAEARRLNSEKAEYEIQKLGQKAGDSTYEDVKGALSAAFRDSNNPAKAFANALGNAIFTRVTASLADALATAAVGKSGQGGLFGDLLGMIGSVVGGGYSVDTSGRGINAPDINGTRGGMATGTNFVPRDMVALLHRGEQVVPARYNPHAGGSAPSGGMQVHYHVPAGQSPAAYAAALEQNNRALYARFAGDLARPGRVMNNAMLAGA